MTKIKNNRKKQALNQKKKNLNLTSDEEFSKLLAKVKSKKLHELPNRIKNPEKLLQNIKYKLRRINN